MKETSPLESEFDKFADEYYTTHASNIKLSGENPEYFHEYKVQDTRLFCIKNNIKDNVEILDFGAGTGSSIPYFNEIFKKSKLHCLDVSKKSIEIAKKRFPKNTFDYQYFNGEKTDYAENKFDLIFSACVFHHIPPQMYEKILNELHRILKPGGVIIIFEHNPLNPLTRHAVNTCPFDENAILISANKMKRKLIKSGFKNIEINYRIFFPSFLKKLRFLEKNLMKLPLGAQYYAAARK